MVTKEEVHKLVDRLEQDDLEVAALYLKNLSESTDPFRKFLESVPEEDEPLSEEEAKAIDEAKAETARGEVYSFEDMRREFLSDAE